MEAKEILIRAKRKIRLDIKEVFTNAINGMYSKLEVNGQSNNLKDILSNINRLKVLRDGVLEGLNNTSIIGGPSLNDFVEANDVKFFLDNVLAL